MKGMPHLESARVVVELQIRDRGAGAPGVGYGHHQPAVFPWHTGV